LGELKHSTMERAEKHVAAARENVEGAWRAAQTGDVPTLERHLQTFGRSIRSVVTRDIHSRGLGACLQYLVPVAAANGHSDVVRVLFEYEKDVLCTHHVEQAMHSAVWWGSPTAAAVLLETKAHPDSCMHAVVALARAACQGHVSVMRALLAAGASVDGESEALTAVYHRPLVDAVRHGHLDAVHLLLEAKANVDAKDDHGRLPLTCAVQCLRAVDMVGALLAAKACVDAVNGKGRRPVHIVASTTRAHSAAVLRLLLAAKSNVENSDLLMYVGAHVVARDHMSGKHAAPCYGAGACRHPCEHLHVLVAAKAAVGPAAVFAAKIGNVKLLRAVLHAKADPNMGCRCTDDAFTGMPLGMASDQAHAHAVRVLLRAKATTSIDLADALGRTPLRLAAQRGGNEAVVRLLLQAKASVEAQEHHPLCYAAAVRGNRATVAALLEARASPRMTTARANILASMPAFFAWPNQRTPDRFRALHCAVVSMCVENVELLLTAKATVNDRDKWGHTPLDLAFQLGADATHAVVKTLFAAERFSAP
jgi:ankyrin repeat protein